MEHVAEQELQPDHSFHTPSTEEARRLKGDVNNSKPRSRNALFTQGGVIKRMNSPSEFADLPTRGERYNVQYNCSITQDPIKHTQLGWVEYGFVSCDMCRYVIYVMCACGQKHISAPGWTIKLYYFLFNPAVVAVWIDGMFLQFFHFLYPFLKHYNYEILV